MLMIIVIIADKISTMLTCLCAQNNDNITQCMCIVTKIALLGLLGRPLYHSVTICVCFRLSCLLFNYFTS